MNAGERAAMRALVAAAKGARDSLEKVPKGSPPGDARIGRDLARLEAAIGAGEATLSGAANPSTFTQGATRL